MLLAWQAGRTMSVSMRPTFLRRNWRSRSRNMCRTFTSTSLPSARTQTNAITLSPTAASARQVLKHAARSRKASANCSKATQWKAGHRERTPLDQATPGDKTKISGRSTLKDAEALVVGQDSDPPDRLGRIEILPHRNPEQPPGTKPESSPLALPRSAMESPAATLAGGLGIRLRPAVADRPKVLAPVNGRPYLSYLLDQLLEASVHQVVLLTGHGADQVRQTF